MLLETTRLPFLVGVVITIAVLVVLMTYVVMPAVTLVIKVEIILTEQQQLNNKSDYRVKN